VWLATQRINARLIAEKMDVPMMEIDLQMTNLGTIRNEKPEYKYSFQRWYISFFLGMLTVYNPQIKNLYYGLNNEDTTAVNPQMRGQMETFMGVMTGDNRLQTPLSHLTKAQQWEIIPDDVKPLVLTCFSGVCGTCFKCKERIDAGIPLK
jgi:7-cyano-7-deazaguanine synthase in queuosine biosynthesis